MGRRTEHGEIWEADVDTRRPVVIVSRDDVRGVRSKTTVAWITSTVRDLPTEVPVGPPEGLARVSVVNCDEIATIQKAELVRRIGRLSRPKIEAVHAALRFAFDID